MNVTRKVFVSSVHTDFATEREELHGWISRNGGVPWTFEHTRTQAEWDALGADEVRRICLQHVRDSDLCVALFDSNYGSTAADHAAGVSCTALEVFAAFQALRPLRVYVLAPGPSSGPLFELLILLRELIPEAVTICGTRPALLDAVKRDLGAQLGATATETSRSTASRFLTASIAQRLPLERSGRLAMPTDHPARPPTFVRERAEAWIVRAEAGDDDLQSRLDAAWFALGELANVPWTEPRFNEHRALWDRTLSAWDNAAAWYGLHSLDDLAKVSALRTLLGVRAMGTSIVDPTTLSPDRLLASHVSSESERWARLFATGGALASSYYSLALADPTERERFLRSADEWVGVGLRGAGIVGNMRQHANLLSIRGNILMRQGDLASALKQMDEVVKLKKTWCPESVAESLGDLGVLQVRSGESVEGFRNLREAVSLLEGAGAQPGFTARAKRQYLFALMSKGELLEMRRQLQELSALCEAFGIRDQWRRAGDDLAEFAAGKIGRVMPAQMRELVRAVLARGAAAVLAELSTGLRAAKTSSGYVYTPRDA